MKTEKGWDCSGLDLDEYLAYPCEIDEELYMYILESTFPKYHYSWIWQGGDCCYMDSYWTDYYMSVLEKNGKYFYIGILPAFFSEEQ